VLAKKGDKHFAQGMKYQAAKQWDKATEEFALALAADPSDMEYQLHFRRAQFKASRIYLLQGRALAEQRDYLGAYNLFKKANGLDPENTSALSEMERVLNLQSEWERTSALANGQLAKMGEPRDIGSPAAQTQKTLLSPSSTLQPQALQSEEERIKGLSSANVDKTVELPNREIQSEVPVQSVPLAAPSSEQIRSYSSELLASSKAEARGTRGENRNLADQTGESNKTISDKVGQFSFARVFPKDFLLKEGFESTKLPFNGTDKLWIDNFLSSIGRKNKSDVAAKGLPQNGNRPSMEIPRVSRAPKLEDFLDMQPNSELAGQMTKIEGLVQRNPKDGAPASQRTEVYLGYDDSNFYSVFVCFDTEPGSVRARMVRREDISGDDAVELMLDTYNDQRRAYAFRTNPFGIQQDALFTEGSEGDEDAEREGFDPSFDTLWYSEGKLTDRGYVVWMAIPFRSLRFSSEKIQTWGVLLNRDIPRLNEEAFWPQYTLNIEGRLNQMATANHMESISPGRNIQLIPYGLFRSARSLNELDENNPFFQKRTHVDGGLDAKIGIKDNLALDVAVNPDFNQVESDEPQVTVTERFAVEFPEKRPFFLENANYFRTPLNLVFTRNIIDPQFGVRATGKLGPYAVGAFVIDDESPGKIVPPDDPLVGKRARFGIFRVNRDIFEQSTIGALYTDREFLNSYNRVLAADGRFKLNDNWVAGFQAALSRTQFLDGSKLSGSAYNASITRSGRSLGYDFSYNSFSPGFFTESGFVERTDIHDFKQTVDYRFRPEGKYLISWGPRVVTEGVFDYTGLRLDFTQGQGISFELPGETEFGFEYYYDRERLRPKDFEVLTENKDFRRNETTIFFNTSFFDWFTFEGTHGWGQFINFDPPDEQAPFLTNATESEFLLTVRPKQNLRIDNTYLLTRLLDRETGANVLQNHIIRSRWNYQFNRELSLRVIFQYESLLTNEMFTDEEVEKNFNADFLVTYLINPWTALHVGYNNNRQNIDIVPTDSGAEVIRRRNRFINDGRQFFVKFSYLFRF
jgi:tetratricopeptide (TPR) repeat protein